MQINISTRHGQIGTETQQKIETKLSKLARFHDRITLADVIVDLAKADDAKVEVRLSVERTQDMLANANGNNLLGALDGCVHKLEEQLRRHKEKTVEHRGTGRRTEVPIAADDDDIDEQNE